VDYGPAVFPSYIGKVFHVKIVCLVLVVREAQDHPSLVSEPRLTNKSQPNSPREKRVVTAPTQGPM
jgi:hypothetical protein